MTTASSNDQAFPALHFAEWSETCAALHRFTQLVGKVRLAATPWLNHSWHATLYVTARGLTTSTFYTGRQALQIDFDFIEQVVELESSEHAKQRLPLQGVTVAQFRENLLRALHAFGVDLAVSDVPNEIPNAQPFSRDTAQRRYVPEHATRFWRVLLEVDRVFKAFRTGFVGKDSPVHLFWGSLDLAVTRFSGRRAPRHPGGVVALPDRVTREAYSHEVSSAGFWPGDAEHDASFYSYAYPSPAGFSERAVRPEGASFDAKLGEFVLPYESVRSAADPNATLLAFLQSTYEAAAELSGWDREALERPLAEAGVCPRV